MKSARLVLAASLLVVGLLTALVVSKVTVLTDMSFFLPTDPSPEVAALSNGMVQSGSIVMIKISGPDERLVATASQTVTEALRGQEAFAVIRNGRPELSNALRDYFLDHRYILGPPLDPSGFETAALRMAFRDGIANLGTLQGWLFRDLFPRDPQGRLQQLARGVHFGDGPPRRNGVWMTAAGNALILARLRASAGDLDAQADSLNSITAAFQPFAEQGISWQASGPGLFALHASERIRSEMQILTTIAGLLVVVILIMVFRSSLMLVLVGLPVGLGILSGVIVTQALFGNVHGVALTFGGVLAGVAADYPIHLAGFRRDNETPAMTARRLSSPLMIGAGTTIAGLAALSQSSFPGLAQIGTLATTAMLTAALVSRWLLPYITPGITIRMRGDAGLWQMLSGRPRLRLGMRWAAVVLVVGSIAAAFASPGPLWETDLSRLSVADAQSRALDRELRENLKLPDASRLLLVEANDAQSVLERQTALFPQLDRAIAEGRLGGYHAAAQLLPPVSIQLARRAALPPSDVLRQRITEAARGLPVSADTFGPFIADVARQRGGAPLTPDDIVAGPAAAFFEAPWRVGDHWVGNVMLLAPAGLLAADLSGANLVDLRQVTMSLVTDYRNEALLWLGFGALLAIAVLGIGLGKPRRVLRAVIPPGFAVIMTAALLIASGAPLNLFHILALLLVASIGVDYALFFQGYSAGNDNGSQALQSVTLCCVTTVSVFAVLSFSSLPILSAIGMTVAMGSVISYLLTVCFAEE